MNKKTTAGKAAIIAAVAQALTAGFGLDPEVALALTTGIVGLLAWILPDDLGVLSTLREASRRGPVAVLLLVLGTPLVGCTGVFAQLDQEHLCAMAENAQVWITAGQQAGCVGLGDEVEPPLDEAQAP